MARRRHRRQVEKARRHTRPPEGAASRSAIRETTRVERLAYTRTQAAEALGLGRTTFNRRVLPLVDIVEMPWGAKLIPADELERLLAEHRRPARGRPQPARPGRPASVAPDVVDRIHTERAGGKSLADIAGGLNESRTPTAHGGTQWWPSTVRAVLVRSTPATSAKGTADAA
jgi:hypothetical protein